MRDGVGLTEFPPGDLAVLVVTGVGYLLVGYLAFRKASRVARKRGVMGHY